LFIIFVNIANFLRIKAISCLFGLHIFYKAIFVVEHGLRSCAQITSHFGLQYGA